MDRIARGVVVLALSLMMLSAAAFAQSHDSCGGGCPKLPNNTRSVSAEFITLATYPGNTLTATLAKGKKHTVLRATGMMTEPNAEPFSREFDLGISVNGLAMRPSSYGPGAKEAREDCGVFRSDPDRVCTVVGHWWLDMDDPANAALLSVPITVTLVGGDPSGGSAVGNEGVDISLEIRLDKK